MFRLHCTPSRGFVAGSPGLSLIGPPIQRILSLRVRSFQMPADDPLNISGQLVAEKYRIEHLVGEGGFAVVYRAEHTIWKQPVAMKFFSGLSQALPNTGKSCSNSSSKKALS